MVCALIDEWVYTDINGGHGIYGRQELERNFKTKVKSLSVSFLDYQTKIINVTDEQSESHVFLNNVIFDDSYLTAREHITPTSIQVIGVKKETVDGIYKYFNAAFIENLVPYGIAIRAVLKSKGFLEDNQPIIFLDDLRNQILLTVFEHNYFSESRRIGMRDVSYMISEIKRSFHNFGGYMNRDVGDFRLMSNNAQWLEEFIKQGFISKGNAIYIDSPLMVLDGLKNAKFTIHFAPINEIIKQKKRDIFVRNIRMMFIGFILIISGLLPYFVSQYLEKQELGRYTSFKKERGHLELSLKNLYQNKFLNIPKDHNFIKFGSIYCSFVKSVPYGYITDYFQFKQNNSKKWTFCALLYPQDRYTKEHNFDKRGYFNKATISHIIFNRSFGQKIDLELEAKDDS